jgi:LCP family protein required for cell wall assembly
MESRQREGIENQIGQRLRLAREEQGWSRGAVERVIRIHAHHLEALERGDFGALPNPLWARGFLIAYANHLGLEGERLADEVLPRERSYRPKRYLERHWRALTTTLGAIGVVVAVTIATIAAPYNPFTGPFSDFLHKIAPDTFMGTGPTRIVVVGFAKADSTGNGNVMLTKVAQDGIGVLSVPQNTLIEIPGHGEGRVGDAIALGGPDLTRRAVVQLSGLEVPHYLVVRPKGIKEIVDVMDGVRIDVPNSVVGQARPGGPKLTLEPGTQMLSGNQALVYLQGRDLLSEAERAERQQAFLMSMFRQALGPTSLLSNPNTLETLLQHVETNMGTVEVVQLAARAKALNDSGVSTETGMLPGRLGATYPGQNNAQNRYWIPDTRKLPAVLKETAG